MDELDGARDVLRAGTISDLSDFIGVLKTRIAVHRIADVKAGGHILKPLRPSVVMVPGKVFNLKPAQNL
jgi:hypothetical protein